MNIDFATEVKVKLNDQDGNEINIKGVLISSTTSISANCIDTTTFGSLGKDYQPGPYDITMQLELSNVEEIIVDDSTAKALPDELIRAFRMIDK